MEHELLHKKWTFFSWCYKLVDLYIDGLFWLIWSRQKPVYGILAELEYFTILFYDYGRVRQASAYKFSLDSNLDLWEKVDPVVRTAVQTRARNNRIVIQGSKADSEQPLSFIKTKRRTTPWIDDSLMMIYHATIRWRLQYTAEPTRKGTIYAKGLCLKINLFRGSYPKRHLFGKQFSISTPRPTWFEATG